MTNNSSTHLLPANPDYDCACDLIDNSNNQKDGIWPAVISHICQQHQLQRAPFSCINGWANAIFVLDNDLLIKIVPPNWDHQASSEIAALTLLDQQALPVAIPRLIANGNINGWMYLVMNKLQGTNLHEIYNDLSVENRISLATEVAQFARHLNQIKVEPQGPLYKPWNEFLLKQKTECYERRKKQGLAEPLLADLMAFLERVDYQPKTDLFNQGQSVLVHTDLHPGNLLVEKVGDNWQLSGVIDFGDALICADPYFDLTSSMIFMGLGDKTINQAILAAYQLNITESQKAGFQQHLMALCLLRHTGQMNYPLKIVPGCLTLNDWQAVGEGFFTL
jgi:hygromycin-B 7''-O-kinase